LAEYARLTVRDAGELETFDAEVVSESPAWLVALEVDRFGKPRPGQRQSGRALRRDAVVGRSGLRLNTMYGSLEEVAS
jgi:hypothetical protein